MHPRCARNRPGNPVVCATRKPTHARRGATAVEMAVVIPVLLVLVFGLIEFARITMVKQALTDAARAGCRTAILATTTDVGQAESTLRNNLNGFLSGAESGSLQVAFTPSNFVNIQPGELITAHVTVACDDVSWIPLGFMENEMLHAEVRMKRE